MREEQVCKESLEHLLERQVGTQWECRVKIEAINAGMSFDPLCKKKAACFKQSPFFSYKTFHLLLMLHSARETMKTF